MTVKSLFFCVTIVFMSISAVFIFLVILLVLVIVHEFGHFIVAKWTNMRVDEFAFGFPPKIFSRKYGETKYVINALPLGGYVSIWGENGEPDDEAKTHPRAFGNRPWWAQLLVLIAGVTMNMLLALFIFIGVSYGEVYMSVDDPIYGSRVKNSSLVILDSAIDSPAYKAGLTQGSTLIKVQSGASSADLTTATSLIAFIGKHNNDTFNITFKNAEGTIMSTSIASVYGIIPDKKALGISVDNVGVIKTSLLEAIKIGSENTYNITLLTLTGLKDLIKSLRDGGNVLESLSGPVGIAKIVGSTSNYGYSAVLSLVAILSINLAIFNILPLPALDGGRIVVVLVETIIRRKIPFKYYSWLNVVGFLALMLLLVLVTINDVSK